MLATWVSQAGGTGRGEAAQALPYTIEEVAVDSAAFEQVLRLRQAAFGRTEAGQREEIDSYSWQFAAFHQGQVVGALRVTCRKDGPLESQAAYPAWLLDHFGDRLAAGSRMCVQPELAGLSSLPLDLTAFAWKRALAHGVRIDVSKARLKAIPFYMRIGYLFVRDSLFRFDKWDTPCALMALPADPNHRSRLAHLFLDVEDTCDLSGSALRDRFTDSYREFATCAAQYGRRRT
jgi:hypothetical protein